MYIIFYIKDIMIILDILSDFARGAATFSIMPLSRKHITRYT